MTYVCVRVWVCLCLCMCMCMYMCMCMCMYVCVCVCMCVGGDKVRKRRVVGPRCVCIDSQGLTEVWCVEVQ